MDGYYINQSVIINIIIITIVIILLVYLIPFILSPWIKFFSYIFGYLRGKRIKKRHIFNLSYPEEAKAESVTASNLTSAEEDAQKSLDKEMDYLNKIYDEKLNSIIEELNRIREGSNSTTNRFLGWRKSSKTTIICKRFNAIEKLIDKELAKNIFLLLGISIFLLIDAIIASHVLTSLKLFTAEDPFFYIKKQEVGYPLIYGIFFTVTATFVLHLLWPRQKIKAFFNENKWSLIIGGGTLLVFFIIRLLMVIAPNNENLPKIMLEVLLLISWIVGVIGVYWLIGEVVGDETDWFKLTIAVFAPLVLILLAIFGTYVFIELVVEWSATAICKSWLEVRKTRALQQKRNVLKSKLASKAGFYRGLAL